MSDQRLRDRERKYALEAGDYNWLADMFDGCCWICQRPETVPNRRLAIDHDHTTHQVRGLLCTRCNQVLGRMNDDPALFRAAADYLEKARSAFSDGCQECMALPEVEKWMYPPAAIIEADEGWTQFGYRCDRGHRWTCGWASRGIPIGWSI